MKKISGSQIVAFLALFGILIGIVGTGLLIIFSGGNATNNNKIQENITQEDLQKIINSSKDNESDTLTGTKK